MRSSKDVDGSGSISSLVTRLADALGRLLTEHLELAKLELKGDAKALATLVAKLAVSIPFVLVGYAFLCAGICLFLSRWLALEAVVAVAGGVNLILGGLLAYAAVRRLNQQKVMDDTLKELSRSVAVLAPDGHPKLPEAQRERRQ
jgi:uncharacterized membrane protein YqjE